MCWTWSSIESSNGLQVLSLWLIIKQIKDQEKNISAEHRGRIIPPEDDSFSDVPFTLDFSLLPYLLKTSLGSQDFHSVFIALFQLI